VGCWCGYLSGARCRVAYRPADATKTVTGQRRDCDLNPGLLRPSQHANHSATKRKISALTTALNKISNVVEYFGEAVLLVSWSVYATKFRRMDT